MKSSLKKKVILCVMALGTSVNYTVYAGNPWDAVESIGGNAENIVDSITSGTVGTVADGINDVARTVTGTTTIKGKVTTNTKTGDITQTIDGGTKNVNDLNVGSVSGGSYIDGNFTSIVKTGDITQTLNGNNNLNRANLGSVTR